MFLRKTISYGKPYLSFIQGYRDENGKVKQKKKEEITELVKKILNSNEILNLSK